MHWVFCFYIFIEWSKSVSFYVCMLTYRFINPIYCKFYKIFGPFHFLQQTTEYHMWCVQHWFCKLSPCSVGVGEVSHCGAVLSSPVNTVDDLSSFYVLQRFIHFMWLYIFISLLKNHFVYLYSSSLLRNIYLWMF